MKSKHCPYRNEKPIATCFRYNAIALRPLNFDKKSPKMFSPRPEMLAGCIQAPEIFIVGLEKFSKHGRKNWIPELFNVRQVYCFLMPGDLTIALHWSKHVNALCLCVTENFSHG